MMDNQNGIKLEDWLWKGNAVQLETLQNKFTAAFGGQGLRKCLQIPPKEQKPECKSPLWIRDKCINGTCELEGDIGTFNSHSDKHATLLKLFAKSPKAYICSIEQLKQFRDCLREQQINHDYDDAKSYALHWPKIPISSIKDGLTYYLEPKFGCDGCGTKGYRADFAICIEGPQEWIAVVDFKTGYSLKKPNKDQKTFEATASKNVENALKVLGACNFPENVIKAVVINNYSAEETTTADFISKANKCKPQPSAMLCGVTDLDNSLNFKKAYIEGAIAKAREIKLHKDKFDKLKRQSQEIIKNANDLEAALNESNGIATVSTHTQVETARKQFLMQAKNDLDNLKKFLETTECITEQTKKNGLKKALTHAQSLLSNLRERKTRDCRICQSIESLRKYFKGITQNAGDFEKALNVRKCHSITFSHQEANKAHQKFLKQITERLEKLNDFLSYAESISIKTTEDFLNKTLRKAEILAKNKLVKVPFETLFINPPSPADLRRFTEAQSILLGTGQTLTAIVNSWNANHPHRINASDFSMLINNLVSINVNGYRRNLILQIIMHCGWDVKIEYKQALICGLSFNLSSSIKPAPVCEQLFTTKTFFMKLAECRSEDAGGNAALAALQEPSQLSKLSPLLIWRNNSPFLMDILYMEVKDRNIEGVAALRGLFLDHLLNPPKHFPLMQLTLLGDEQVEKVFIPKWRLLPKKKP